MSADGTSQLNLTSDALPAVTTESGPAWSPDGSRIAFASDYGALGNAKLWTMRSDGRDKRRVLPLVTDRPEIDVEPSWSPDGTRIVFRRFPNSSPQGNDIVIATFATRTVTRIALPGEQFTPAWSPDGSRIAFASSHEDLLAHIYTMRPDGTQIVRHTLGGGDYNISPRWMRAATAAAQVAGR